MSRIDFNIGVYGANEAATIGAGITAIDQACAGHAAHISVLLNGTTDDSVAVLRQLRLTHATMTVYLFPVADKANAIDYFFYSLRRDAEVHFCIDAYTRIEPGALRAIATAMRRQPAALIASGIPVNGRSARTVPAATIKGGVVNQVYGLRPDFIDRMVAAGVRLPVQLYRGDSLLGSMAAHDLDAMGKPWDNARVIGVADARFALLPLSIFRPRDLRRQYMREIRQARGRMENAAVQKIIYSQGYGGLPDNASDMIDDWLKTARPAPRSMREAYFTRLALRQLATAPRLQACAPVELFSTGGAAPLK